MHDDRRALAEMAWVPFGRGPQLHRLALAQMELTLTVAPLARPLARPGERPGDP